MAFVLCPFTHLQNNNCIIIVENLENTESCKRVEKMEVNFAFEICHRQVFKHQIFLQKEQCHRGLFITKENTILLIFSLYWVVSMY